MNPKTSQDLFNKIRSLFSNIKIGDENGGATANPENAVFFEFEYQPDSDTFGSVSVLSLIHISEPTRNLSISYAVLCLK